MIKKLSFTFLLLAYTAGVIAQSTTAYAQPPKTEQVSQIGKDLEKKIQSVDDEYDKIRDYCNDAQAQLDQDKYKDAIKIYKQAVDQFELVLKHSLELYPTLPEPITHTDSLKVFPLKNAYYFSIAKMLFSRDDFVVMLNMANSPLSNDEKNEFRTLINRINQYTSEARTNTNHKTLVFGKEI